MTMTPLSKTGIKMPRSRKGILLTLLIIVLFILMLTEVVTYIVVSINYNTLAQLSSQSSTQGFGALQLNSMAGSELHQSLSAALSTLTYIESNPGQTRNTTFVNNTSYMLVSLMTNGTIYGRSFVHYGNAIAQTTYGSMAGAIMGNFSNTIAPVLAIQGVNLTINNANISVYQTLPGYINASYTAFATATSAAGTFSYPIFVTTSVPLNGTLDLLQLEQGNPTYMSIINQTPAMSKIAGGAYTAVAGTNSPFMFAAGTLVVLPSPSSCSSIPSAVQTSNFILVTPSAASLPAGGCGMGGIITNAISATNPLIPYLVYPLATSPNIFAYLQNGTQVLMGGPGKTIYNFTSLQSAINKGNNYYPTPYAPSYFNYVQNQPYAGTSGAGLFNFNLYNTAVGYFNGNAIANVYYTSVPPIVDPTGSPPFHNFTINVWFNGARLVEDSGQHDDGLITVGCATIGGACQYSGPFSGLQIAVKNDQPYAALTGGGAGSTTDPCTANSIITLQDNQWYFLTYEYNQSQTGGTYNNQWLYLNGLPLNTCHETFGGGYVFAGANIIRVGSDYPWPSGGGFNGMIADVQVYNGLLNTVQLTQLYKGGINSPPIVSSHNLTAWYTFQKTTTDSGPFGLNATTPVNGINYTLVKGFYYDPIVAGSLSAFNISGVVEGVNGCTNPSQCTNTWQQRMYITNSPLLNVKGIVENESAAFGAVNAIFPRAMRFTGRGYVATTKDLSCTGCTLWSSQGSTPPLFLGNIWVYPYSGNGVILDARSSSTPNTGSHNSIIELVNGVGYVRWPNDGSCQSLGAIPIGNWTDIGFGMYGSGGSYTFYGYVNGVQKTGAAQPGNGGMSPLYFALGPSDSVNCGSGIAFNGLLADFQLVNGDTNTAPYYDQVYLNNTYSGTPTNVLFPLYTGYEGFMNITQDVGSTPDSAILYNTQTGTQCYSGNVLAGACAESYVP